MGYIKLEEFINHVVTGTEIVVEEDVFEGHIYYQGKLGNYFYSGDMERDNLLLVQAFVEGDRLHLRVVKNLEN